jgi:3-hydroxyacyl-CoA dehydrogenase
MPDSIAVIGAGSIGTAWAALFAAAGHPVRLQDVDAARRTAAPGEVSRHLGRLAEIGAAGDGPDAALRRVTVTPDLDEAVAGAAHVQECVPEALELKRELFAMLDSVAPAGAVLASSSSFLPASAFAGDCAGRHRILVVHPGNPPTLLRVAEIVPAPFTAADTVLRTERLLQAAGLTTVTLAREVDGFVFNRLQGAVLREAYALVEDGVATPEEIDAVVRDGVGLRWAVAGPFETVDLNTRGGIAAHAQRMLPAYRRMGAQRGERPDTWSDRAVDTVVAARRAALPLEGWAERVAWRDDGLIRLLRARRTSGTG